MDESRIQKSKLVGNYVTLDVLQCSTIIQDLDEIEAFSKIWKIYVISELTNCSDFLKMKFLYLTIQYYLIFFPCIIGSFLPKIIDSYLTLLKEGSDREPDIVEQVCTYLQGAFFIYVFWTSKS